MSSKADDDMKTISIIIVHYHTPDLLINLLNSFFETTDLSNNNYEIIIVNNGGALDRLHQVEFSIPLNVFHSDSNIGYSAAINRGVAESKGEVLIVMNADIKLLKGAIRSLSESLDECDVVGPQFYLDENSEFILPPTERYDLLYRMLKELSLRNSFYLKRFQDLWWHHAARHILAVGPVQSFHLSGSLLAFKRETWNKVGSFDERYRLYFEEIDWLLRVKRAGLKALYQPMANVVHYYNQSAKSEKDAQKWFEESEMKFYSKTSTFFSRSILTFLKNILTKVDIYKFGLSWEREKKNDGEPFIPISFQGIPDGDVELFVQMSVSRTFVPSAVYRLNRNNIDGWSFVGDLWSRLAPAKYYFRIIDRKGGQILPRN